VAGIGFELEKLFEKDTYTAEFSAYMAAGLILAGSWVFSVLAIIVITIYSTAELTARNQSLLLVITTYSYAGAMLVTSLLSIPVTRFIADRLYLGEADAFGPSYAAYCLVHWIAAVLIGAVFYGLNPLSGTLKLLGMLLLVACTQVWLSANFIGLLRAYAFVAFSFLIGYGLATAAAVFLGRAYGLEGYLAGFTLGMSVLALLLTGHLQLEFAYPRATNFGFLALVLQRPALALIGLFLALGTWIDKLVFWVSESHAHAVTPYLRFYPPYDMSFFLGYVTVIPAYAHFLLRIETSFARHVRHIYSSLVSREPYDRIETGKIRLVETMNGDFLGLLKVQAPLSLLVVYFAPNILEWLRLPSHQSHIFQFSTMAALAVVLVQVQVLYLIYFDLAGAALIPAGVYFVANFLCTWITVQLGYWSYGLGHLVGALMAATAGVWVVNRSVPQLDYITLEHFAGLTLKPAPASNPE
jgi:polysaccharide biosynthesis protein PelG